MTGIIPLKIIVYRRLKGHKSGRISVLDVPMAISKENTDGKYYTLELITEHLQEFLNELNSCADDYEEVKFVIDDEELTYTETPQ